MSLQTYIRALQVDQRVLAAMYLMKACGWFVSYKGQGMSTPRALLRAAEFLLIIAALEGGLELVLRAAHRAHITFASPTYTATTRATTTTTTGELQLLAAGHVLVVDT